MRIFIAIDFPDEVKRRIIEVAKKVRSIDGKRVEEENLHITLKFIGEIDDNIVNEIKEELKFVNYNKFYIKISGVGLFGNRVLWLGISRGYQDIVNLHNIIEEKLLKFKIERDFNFHPHITLYRIKQIINKKDFEDSLKEIEKFSLDNILVDKFYLKQSILRWEGPIYRNIAEYKLL
ncbi:MAG: RNA 2',3'-cyclic phosphodiesterase [Nanopusillaceae archaeon]